MKIVTDGFSLLPFLLDGLCLPDGMFSPVGGQLFSNGLCPVGSLSQAIAFMSQLTIFKEGTLKDKSLACWDCELA